MSIMSFLSSLSVCARVSVCACVRFCVCVCLCVSVCVSVVVCGAEPARCHQDMFHWLLFTTLARPHRVALPPFSAQRYSTQFFTVWSAEAQKRPTYIYNIHECKSCINIPSFRYGLHCTEYKILFLQCCAEYYRKAVQNFTIHRKSNTREPFQCNDSSVLCTVSFAEKTRTVSRREEEGFVGLCRAVHIYRVHIYRVHIYTIQCIYRVRIYSA